MTRTVPEGFTVKGVSTLYNAEGEVAAQWVKSRAEDEDRAAAQREFVAELCSQVKPRKRIVPAPKKTDAELCVGYPIGDHHMGMYAYAAETGGDYDLKIASQTLAAAIDYLVDRSPSADEAIVANLGDFLHADNRGNRTPASGHVLDVDTRYSRVIRVAAFGLAHAIERALEKHKRVRVVNVPGNHDPDSASWLSLVLEAWFKNEPRVTVDISPAQFLFYQFGQNMICMTHGHTIKLEEVPATMAAYQPEMWGTSKYRVAWTGHVHHSQRLALKGNRGAKVESFGVLPPNDAYGASRGFLSHREMHAITFKRAGGELGRATYNVDLQ
jgi:predicted phosphodiesterase